MATARKVNFEKSIERLEVIVDKLEDGETSLDESIRLYQEGRKLGAQCSELLSGIEKKARLLLEDEEGQVTEAPMDVEESDDDGEGDEE